MQVKQQTIQTPSACLKTLKFLSTVTPPELQMRKSITDVTEIENFPHQKFSMQLRAVALNIQEAWPYIRQHCRKG